MALVDLVLLEIDTETGRDELLIEGPPGATAIEDMSRCDGRELGPAANPFTPLQTPASLRSRTPHPAAAVVVPCRGAQRRFYTHGADDPVLGQAAGRRAKTGVNIKY
uniref:Uncharacterized protein n=1 Tax=Knipowitschia caucasica TaxID=637954 RepID=A0AAV2L8J6_KNICA